MQRQRLYAACVSETETDRLEKLVLDTEGAMFLRLQELAYELRSKDELRDLNRAATALLEVKVEKLGWPDPFRMNTVN